MQRYWFELATANDDAALRRVLADTPLPGPISMIFRREPSYFEAAEVEGQFRQVLVAREDVTDTLVGFISRSIRDVYVNGRPGSVGYVGGLRLLAAHRNRGVFVRGVAFFRKLHADGRVPLYLAAIPDGNQAALTTLTSGRGGLPTLHFLGRYHSALIPPACRGRQHRGPSFPLLIRPAAPEDRSAVLGLLRSEGPRRQFFPRYQEVDFFTGRGALCGLRPDDLLLAFRGRQLVGTLAGWDQHPFRQTVVHNLSMPLRLLRHLVNGWARFRGLPHLPGPGEEFRHLTAALPVVAGDDPGVFAALLDELRSREATARGCFVLLGLHEADPLLAVVRARQAWSFTTRLFLACWKDGEEALSRLDRRVPYLELGSL